MFKISDQVIYKNNQFIAFNKPPAIPVQPDRSDTKSLQELAEIYCKTPIHLVHRIDRPASGIVLFAKTKKAVAHLNLQFQKQQINKTYLSIVKNTPPESSGQLVHFLKKNGKTNKSTAFDKANDDTKKAVLNYSVLDKSIHYTLLKIELQTGRHHQIRAQLSAIMSPIKGDVKYGARRKNKDRSIHLHAWKLKFQHPVSLESVELKADLPEEVLWQSFEKTLWNK